MPKAIRPHCHLPYRNLAGNLQQQIEQAIREHSQATQVFESVLIRKKWLSEAYAFSLDKKDEKDEKDEKLALSAWLTGWRQAWVMATLLPIMQVSGATIEGEFEENSFEEKIENGE